MKRVFFCFFFRFLRTHMNFEREFIIVVYTIPLIGALIWMISAWAIERIGIGEARVPQYKWSKEMKSENVLAGESVGKY